MFNLTRSPVAPRYICWGLWGALLGLLSRQGRGHAAGLAVLSITAPSRPQICSCSTECGQVKGNSCINMDWGIQLALGVLFLVWNDRKAQHTNALVTKTFKDMETLRGGEQGTRDTDTRSGLKQPTIVGKGMKGKGATQDLGVLFSKQGLLKYSG